MKLPILGDRFLKMDPDIIMRKENMMKSAKRINEISCIKLCFSAAPLAMSLTVINMIILTVSPLIL